MIRCPLVPWLLYCLVSLLNFPIGDKSLKQTSADRIIDFGSPAVDFTGMGADSPANSRERDRFTDQINRLLKSSLSDQSNIPLHMNPSRTYVRAGRLAHFIDGHTTRLPIQVNDFVVCAGYGDGAYVNAFPTRSAASQIHKTGVLTQCDLKPVPIILNLFHVSIGPQRDLGMPGNL